MDDALVVSRSSIWDNIGGSKDAECGEPFGLEYAHYFLDLGVLVIEDEDGVLFGDVPEDFGVFEAFAVSTPWGNDGDKGGFALLLDFVEFFEDVLIGSDGQVVEAPRENIRDSFVIVFEDVSKSFKSVEVGPKDGDKEEDEDEDEAYHATHDFDVFF